MNFSLASSSMLLVLLLFNAMIIFGVPAGVQGNQSIADLNESFGAVVSNAISHQSLLADQSTTDYSKIGRNVGNDVELFDEGRIPVVLRENKLEFRACNNCSGTSHVCYKSGDIGAKAAKYCSGLTSHCGFEVKTVPNGDEQLFLANGVTVEGECQSFAMEYNVTFGNGYFYPSCKPIIGEHRMVMLESYAQPSCPITIPNAYIPDPPTTVSPALSHETSDSAAAVQSANFFETTEGIAVIIGIILFVLFIFAIIGVIFWLLCAKTKIFKSKAKEVNVESIQVDQPEYTAVEDVKQSEAVLPKKQQPKKKIEKLLVKENVVEKKKKKDAEAPKKLEGKSPKKVVEPAKKAAEEPRKKSAEPKMKSDPTQEPTEDRGPQPVIDEDAPPSPPPAAVAVPKVPAKPKNAVPPPASINQLAPPPSKHQRRHRPVKRAPPTFEAPSTPSTSDSEVPPPPRVATAVQHPPQKKKKVESPTLDSQDRERRRMIRSGQAVKPRPGENIRKYLPKNY